MPSFVPTTSPTFPEIESLSFQAAVRLLSIRASDFGDSERLVFEETLFELLAGDLDDDRSTFDVEFLLVTESELPLGEEEGEGIGSGRYLPSSQPFALDITFLVTLLTRKPEVLYSSVSHSMSSGFSSSGDFSVLLFENAVASGLISLARANVDANSYSLIGEGYDLYLSTPSPTVTPPPPIDPLDYAGPAAGIILTGLALIGLVQHRRHRKRMARVNVQVWGNEVQLGGGFGISQHTGQTGISVLATIGAANNDGEDRGVTSPTHEMQMKRMSASFAQGRAFMKQQGLDSPVKNSHAQRKNEQPANTDSIPRVGGIGSDPAGRKPPGQIKANINTFMETSNIGHALRRIFASSSQKIEPLYEAPTAAMSTGAIGFSLSDGDDEEEEEGGGGVQSLYRSLRREKKKGGGLGGGPNSKRKKNLKYGGGW